MKYAYNTDLLTHQYTYTSNNSECLTDELYGDFTVEKYNNLKVIGDITCDVNGSIPTTSRPSTITDPYYYLDRTTLQEVNRHNQALAVMAVDNLPSELPIDSSNEFGDGIVNEVLPYILKKDDGRIKRATITENGDFLPSYEYLKNYINAT